MRIGEIACEMLGDKFQKRFVGGRSPAAVLGGFACRRQDGATSQLGGPLGSAMRRMRSMALRNRSLAAVAVMPQAAPMSRHFCLL